MNRRTFFRFLALAPVIPLAKRLPAPVTRFVRDTPCALTGKLITCWYQTDRRPDFMCSPAYKAKLERLFSAGRDNEIENDQINRLWAETMARD